MVKLRPALGEPREEGGLGLVSISSKQILHPTNSGNTLLREISNVYTTMRSDGSYDQPEYLSASDSVMSVPSQDLSQSFNAQGVQHHSSLFPPSPAHYFLHAQYHPQFNPSKGPLHHPDYHGNILNPQNHHQAPPPPQQQQQQQQSQHPVSRSNSSSSSTSSSSTGSTITPAHTTNHTNGSNGSNGLASNLSNTRDVKEHSISQPQPSHMTKPHNAVERNHFNNSQVADRVKCDPKTEEKERGSEHEATNGRPTTPNSAKAEDVNADEKQEQSITKKHLNGDLDTKSQNHKYEQESSDRKTPRVEERVETSQTHIKDERTPSPNHRGTGFSPDENEARRRIESFIADQKDQGQTRADTFSPEENRSRRDSSYNGHSRFNSTSPHRDENNGHHDPEGSETGSNYHYGDRHHMRNSMSSDEGSNSQFQNRDSYSGRSSSLSPVSSNGPHGNCSDSAPPTPNHFFSSPGGPFPGFPHSSTPTHSPHKLPPGVSPDNKDLFFCHLCSYVGTSKYHFNAHMNSHFEHRCPHCDYTSRTEGRLKRHMKDFHSDNPPENFSGMKMIRQVSRPKLFKCKQCDYQTEVKVDFWEHSRSHIKEEKVLQCPKCPFVTEYKHHLEYHLRNHFGSKPFKCNKCNYACVNKSMLNSHMKSHTNVYQYRCADCTYATKYCHSLKLHLKKYNHKPATVLNADGSLPTDGSGDFELVSKRGPPRGPRSVKRDKSPPGQGVILPHRTVPGPPPPPPPSMNGGLMSPFWPMMATAQISNSLRAPPPLIPMTGFEHMSMGMPHDPTKMPMGLFPPSMMPGVKSKCSICDFTADSQMQLTQHMFQVHAAENQDLFNMYGIPADSIMEQAMRNVADAANKVVGMGANRSFPAPSPSPKSGSSKSPGTPQHIPTPSWMKQESPEDGLPPITQTPPTTSTPRARPNGEIPLDLTKPKSDFPFGPLSSMDFARVLKRPLSEVDNHDEADSPPAEDKTDDNAECSPTPRKRSRKGKAYKLDTICMKLQERYGPESPAGAEEEDYVSDYNSEQGESNHESLEGAMQRHISHEAPSSNGPVSDNHVSEDQSEEPSGISGRHSAGSLSNERVGPAGIDYKQIHDSIRELNNGFGDQSEQFKDNPEEMVIPSENPEGDVAQALAMAQSRRRESVGSSYSGSINRRKMFIMRHNDDQAAEAAEAAATRGMGSPIAAMIPNNGELRSDSPPLPRIIAPQINDDSMDESPKGGVYECMRCAIMFRDCIMYTMHMGYHGYQDPFKCNMCGHHAKDRVEFFLHIARAAHE